MPINQKYLIVYDFETGSPDPFNCEPLQLAAVAIHPRNLVIVPGSQFQSYIKPRNLDNVQQQALDVNKIRMDMVENAPDLESVFTDFCEYTRKYRSGAVKSKSTINAPMAAGFNILGFDNIIIDRLSKEFKKANAWDEDRQRTNIFNGLNAYDAMQTCWHLFENMDTDVGPENMKLVSILKWAGIPTDGAHNAIVDVQRTATLIIKLMKMHRHVASRLNKTYDEQTTNV